MTSLRFTASAVLAVLTVLATPSVGDACMPGFAHPQKEVILFWHEGVEILIWRARVTPPRGGGIGEEPPPVPSQLAWVLAVPSAPLAYHVVDNDAFDRTTYWARGLAATPPMGRTGGGGGSDGIGGLEVGETVHVGEYDVTPIQADAEQAATALNTWLRRNHFPQADETAVSAYAGEGATFLAVKARVPRGTSTMELRPVGIAFRTDEIVLPIRLSATDDPFGLSAVVVTTRVPELSGQLSSGLVASALRPHHATGDAPIGRVSIVPHTNVPAELRSLVAPITSEVPGFERMLSGSLAVSMLEAQPLSIDVNAPDPKIALGQVVTPNAPIGVAVEGHWDEMGNFAIGPPPEPTPPPEATPPTEATASAAAATDDEEDDGGFCSAGGRARFGPFGAALFALGLARFSARKRRR